VQNFSQKRCVESNHKNLNRIKHVEKDETRAMKVDTNKTKCDSNQPCPDKG
jgi:hypothetical protein